MRSIGAGRSSRASRPGFDSSATISRSVGIPTPSLGCELRFACLAHRLVETYDLSAAHILLAQRETVEQSTRGGIRLRVNSGLIEYLASP